MVAVDGVFLIPGWVSAVNVKTVNFNTVKRQEAHNGFGGRARPSGVVLELRMAEIRILGAGFARVRTPHHCLIVAAEIANGMLPMGNILNKRVPVN